MVAGKLKVGVKYCGHCNPQEEGPALIRRLQQRLPELEVVPWDEKTYDVLLIVSACPSDCVSKPSFTGPRIEVAAGELRNWQIPSGHPAECLLEAFLCEGFKVFVGRKLPK